MKRSSPSKPTKHRKVRLLLHAVDGCVPFLTPDVLEKYFPPSDDLWIGLAVRDTCVLPTFSASNNPKTRQVKPNTASKSSKTTTTTTKMTAERDPKKPRGFTFAPLPADSWLIPYTRVTVPSFDWMQDNDRKKKESSQRPSSGSTSTNQHILVWTPHGRQKLTSDLYALAAGSTGLNSQFTVSLYDMPEESNNPKRLEKADARNEEWFQNLLKHKRNDSSCNNGLWSPILLPTKQSVPEPDGVLTMYHDSIQDVAGVALIGKWWPGLEVLLQSKLADVPQVAMMSTYSLTDILEIVSSNTVDTIGSDLPTEWAKDKLAFAVDFRRTEATAKRAKQDPEQMVAIILNHDGCMDLKDKSFARDPNPLVPGCKCLACDHNKFSRAYIHHLICAKELLADMILFGHNLHHLLELLRAFNNDTTDPQILARVITEQLGTKVIGDTPIESSEGKNVV